MNEQRAAGRARHASSGVPPPSPAAWRDGAEFLRGFLRNPAQVGSVIPSSPQLEQRLVRHAGIAEAGSVVELGPGTGGTTAALLQALPATGRLLAIELDPRFHRHVAGTLHDPRLALERGSAEDLADFLAAHAMDRPDAIVSGIPFSTMPGEVSRRIARGIAQVLRPGGRFVAYQVRPHVERFLTPELGAPLRREWELVNVPPVRVFTWIKR